MLFLFCYFSIGYPVVTLGFGFKSYISYKMKLVSFCTCYSYMFLGKHHLCVFFIFVSLIFILINHFKNYIRQMSFVIPAIGNRLFKQKQKIKKLEGKKRFPQFLLCMYVFVCVYLLMCLFVCGHSTDFII